MSRNARFHKLNTFRGCWLIGLLWPLALPAQPARTNSALISEQSKPRARIIVVHDAEATEAFKPRLDRVRAMMDRAITNLTGQATVAAAWSSLVSAKEVVGLKVCSAAGADAGTRPAVVAAVVEGLLAARIPTNQIIIWDKHRADLRRAGFFDLAAKYGIRVEGSAAAGYDEKTFYEPDKPFLGPLLWSDLEYGRSGEGAGRKSFASKVVTREITRIINISPLLNHNVAGVTGNLYSLALGSVDNTLRFEMDAGRLAQAVPEIYALPALGDRVALNIVDALICQYQGQQVGLLHYSAVLNELRLSTDPVALDVLSLEELERQRQAARISPLNSNLELYQNASLLELGISDPGNIMVERFQ